MCGRFSLVTTKEKLQRTLPFLEVEEAPVPNYNVAPTQSVPIIANDDPRHLQTLIWGLVPYWEKFGKPSAKLINARGETLFEKTAFMRVAQRRRCLVIADSFYEWKKSAFKKMPYRISLRHSELMVFAGIWDKWSDGNIELRTFSILTVPPNKEIGFVHDRMPLVLTHKGDQWNWLTSKDEMLLKRMIHSPENGSFELYPISTAVNSTRNNSPLVHEPWLPPATLF